MKYMVASGASARRILAGLALASTIFTAVPAMAQDQESRLRKVEAEVRALQRQVFPGGDERFFTPEVSPTKPATQVQGTPATTAVTDMLSRLDALEAQVAQLTAQTEENTNAIAQLTSRLSSLESRPAPTPELAPTPSVSPSASLNKPTGVVPDSAIPATSSSTSVKPTQQASAPSTSPTKAPSAERLAAVQAITKPQTNDPGDDEYSYGFRLWEAKFFPEAQQQLKLYVDKYSSHSKVSYGRNLLGRAFLDDGNPREAATWFLQNYQIDKNGARAPDSLLFLAESMIALKDTKRACIALAEFADDYQALATGRLQGQYKADRAKVKCN